VFGFSKSIRKWKKYLVFLQKIMKKEEEEKKCVAVWFESDIYT